MLDKLKNVNVERLDADEAVALLAFANSVSSEYKTQAMPEPRWLQDARKTLTEDIGRRRRDALLRRRAEVTAKLDAMKPASAKRRDLAKELRALDAALV